MALHKQSITWEFKHSEQADSVKHKHYRYYLKLFHLLPKMLMHFWSTFSYLSGLFLLAYIFGTSCDVRYFLNSHLAKAANS